jgi:flagellar hook-associated protein 2
MQTDALVSAIIAQDSLPMNRLQDTQTLNNQRTTALNTMQSDMQALATSLQTLQYTGSGFDARTVTSSDVNNTNVTATASGAAVGNYDLKVASVATQGRITPTLDSSGNATNLAVADPAGGSPVFTGPPPSFAIQGTDGVVKVITLTTGNNSLYGLQSAINASGAGVTASVVNTGSGAAPYQLVLTAAATGTGKTGGLVTLADVTAGGASNSLGIAAGTVDSLTSPTTVSGGLSNSTNLATDAKFSVNGIQLTRTSNVVTDAVQGLTLNLKQGGQTTTTTLTVAQDDSTVTSSMQDVVTKYNTLVTDYNTASKKVKASDGSIMPAPLGDDMTASSMISQVRAALTGIPTGIASSAAFHSAGDMGLSTNTDGTLTLDTTAFKKALDQDPTAARNIFDFTGTTTNGVVTFSQGSAKTAQGKVGFEIDTYNGNTGAWAGILTAPDGTAINVTGTKGGQVNGVAGPALEGIQLNVSGTGSGTLGLTKGVAQATQDTISNLTAYNGTFWNTLASITAANTQLTSQIASQQAVLDQKQAALKLQFAEMEANIAQLKTASAGMVT